LRSISESVDFGRMPEKREGKKLFAKGKTSQTNRKRSTPDGEPCWLHVLPRGTPAG